MTDKAREIKKREQVSAPSDGLYLLAEAVMALAASASVALEDESTPEDERLAEASTALLEARDWLNESGWLPL